MAITNVQSGPFIGVEGGGEVALGDEPVFREGTDTMVWEDPRTRISPEPVASYSTILSMTRNSTCTPSADTTYGRRIQPNVNTDDEACGVSPISGFSLGTIAVPNVGNRQCMVTTVASGGERTITWLNPYSYNASHFFDYDDGDEIIFDFWYQFVSGTIGSSGSKWFEFWAQEINHRIQTSNEAGSFGLGPWGYHSADDPLAQSMTARTPFYDGSSYGTVSSVADGTVQKWTVVYQPQSHCVVYQSGVKIVALAPSHVGITPAGGDKPWCTQDEVDDVHAIEADVDTIDYTLMMDVFNSVASAAVIRHTPARCWVRPTPVGPGAP